jgi:hypothetical protein
VQGSCDLYVVFLERISELLAEGGRFGVVVPNRIAQAEYARGCRRLLLSEMQIDRIDDVSSLRVFPSAAVYPVLLCGVKQRAPAAHRIVVAQPESLSSLGQGRSWFVKQRTLDAERGFSLLPTLDVEARVPTRPLGELAALHSGTTGFAAQRMADALIERGAAPASAWNFITTGNIDRYNVRLGNVRFLRRVYTAPVLPCTTPFLSDRKRRLYAQPKIVLAGMCRRLEAAWNPGDLALGVQVYAAAECRVDPFYLLALLNSKLLSHLFAARHHGKRMAGGHLAINKGQLAQLPILLPTTVATRRLAEELASCAQWLTMRRPRLLGERVRRERHIDQLAYHLYDLSDDEAAAVEADFAAESAGMNEKNARANGRGSGVNARSDDSA